MDKIIFIFTLANFITIGYGAEYFVSPDGNDKNPGTLKKQFRTIQKAVKSVKSGDICFIRGGRYEESIKIDNLKRLDFSMKALMDKPDGYSPPQKRDKFQKG